MLRSSSNLAFPRKVVVYYLLFSLVAVSWLAIGVLYTAHSVYDSRATNTCLARLGRTAAALELEYLRTGTKRLQILLDQCQRPLDLLSYSIVSLEGETLAHVGTRSIESLTAKPSGSSLRWGNVTGLQYADPQGHLITEYRVPLVAHDDHFGTLRIAVRQLSFWNNLTEIARVSPITLILPLSLVALGALFLRRLADPVTQIDAQLCALARERPTTDVELKPLIASSAIAIGWNRVVDAIQATHTDDQHDLETRLSMAVASRGQNRMQDVLHNLAEGIAVTDVEGRLTFANRAVNVLLSTDPSQQELDGIELESHIVETFGEATAKSLFDEASSQRAAVTEVVRSENDDERVLRVARQPLQGHSPQGHVWSVRDITQQKLAEQTRDQFIDAATHEMRTPLSNIKAYAETLVTCDTIEVEEQKEFCNIINSEVTRLARFVDDLLSISSMEAGSITIQRQRTISARLFEEVLDKVKPLMRKKEIDFNVQLPEKMPDLRLDKDKIVAVLVNLLGNAAKYTPTGGRVALRVKIDTQQLQVSVEDTGVGIAPEELPKVFEKFFRSNDPRVQAETGTGLGLALAREVVRMHGGDITAESQIDQGTTFTATIPVQ